MSGGFPKWLYRATFPLRADFSTPLPSLVSICLSQCNSSGGLDLRFPYSEAFLSFLTTSVSSSERFLFANSLVILPIFKLSHLHCLNFAYLFIIYFIKFSCSPDIFFKQIILCLLGQALFWAWLTGREGRSLPSAKLRSPRRDNHWSLKQISMYKTVKRCKQHEKVLNERRAKRDAVGVLFSAVW